MRQERYISGKIEITSEAEQRGIGELDLVAPAGLGAVERLICLAEDSLPRALLATAEGDQPDADGDDAVRHVARMGDPKQPDGLADALHADDAGLGGLLGHDDEELLAAVPIRHVTGADGAGDDLTDRFESIIAGEVAVAVVVELEAIDVTQADGEAAPV